MSELLKEFLAVARGEQSAELVLKEARVVNVYSGEIFLTNLAVHRGRVVGWGDYRGVEEVNLEGRYVVPGLIDAHVHLESAMVLPDEFARQVVPRGVTAVVADPHELANVAGVKGIEFFRQYQGQLPLDIFLQLPSCVPATPDEEAGAILQASDLAQVKDLPGIHGLGEMMDFYGVVAGNAEVLAKLELMADRFRDGHAPLLAGKALNAYVFAGITADHEVTSVEEAREKLRLGMYIMVREGSAAKDLARLLPLIKEKNARRFVFCTDDRHPVDLVEDGHLDFLVRKAVQAGLAPVEAIRMATLNAAECLGLADRGAIAPGKRADLAVVEDLHDFRPCRVYKDGRLVAVNGRLLRKMSLKSAIALTETVRVGELSAESLALPKGRCYRVMEVEPGQLLTREVVLPVHVQAEAEGEQVVDADLAKIVVVERHRATGHVGVGLVKGFGLTRGAIASSVAHDSHNLVAVGKDDASILAALQGVIDAQGGLGLAIDGDLLDILPLPIGGLISDQEIGWVVAKQERLARLAGEMGVRLTDPFMTLSFLALPVIPELKLTTQGLFDVRQNRLVELVVE